MDTTTGEAASVRTSDGTDAREVPRIRLENVRKTFGGTVALDGLSTTVEGPGVVGLVGPNGAGKTTLLRLCSGQFHPDGGTVRICGLDTATDSYRVRRRLVLLPQGVRGQFYTFTPREYVYHYHRFRGKSRSEADRVADAALDRFDVPADRTIDELSGGMVQRTMLAMTLSFDAPVYLLDEPTAGLDPSAKRDLWDRFRGLGDSSLVVLTSHHTDEISDVCDEVVLLDDGGIVLQGDTERIAAEYLPNHGRKLVVERAAAVDRSVDRATVSERGRFRHVYPRDGAAFEAIRDRFTAEGVAHEVRAVTVEDLFITGWADDER